MLNDFSISKYNKDHKKSNHRKIFIARASNYSTSNKGKVEKAGIKWDS
jgi:hypothetical protein